MGTFTISRPSRVVSLSGGRSSPSATPGWYGSGLGGGSTDEILLYSMGNVSINYIATKNTGVVSAEIIFGFDTSDEIFLLDGSIIPISFNDLPAGFTITDASLFIANGSNQTGSVAFQLSGFPKITNIYPPGTVVFSQDIGPITNFSFIFLQVTLQVLMDTTYVGVSDFISLADFFGWGFGGNYIIQSFSFTSTIDTPAVNTIGPNNKIKITSTHDINPSIALDLSHIVTNGIDKATGSYNQLNDTGISGVGLTWVNLAGVTQYYYIPLRYLDPDKLIPEEFIPITPTLLEFEIPPELALLIWQDPTIPGWPDIPVTPIVYGDGTQFSGWVGLTSMTITLVNASGIYRLVKNKTNDTLYDNLNPPATVDVKIPNPFVKTGFIGG